MINPKEDPGITRAVKRKKTGWKLLRYGLILIPLWLLFLVASSSKDIREGEASTKILVYSIFIVSSNASVALIIAGIVLIVLGNTGEKRLRRQKNVRVLQEMKERKLGLDNTGETRRRQQDNVGVLGNPTYAQTQSRRCQHCNNDFEPNNPNQIYCSKTCKRAAHRRRAKR